MHKKKINTKPFLGALKLNWCDQCNLPILDKKRCGKCGNETRKVKLAPPGDIRPAFEKDLVRISSIIDNKYGAGSSEALGLNRQRLVLLNEVGFDDLMDEIIIDGEVVGSIRYLLQLEDWDFYPRLIGAQRIFERDTPPKKKQVTVDEGAVKYIADGANVLAPGVKDLDPHLRKSEAVVVLSPTGKVLSTGTMRINAKELKDKKKGTVVKPKHFLRKSPEPTKANIAAENQTWNEAVVANTITLQEYEVRALRAILRVIERNPKLPLSVSFSGGKDSLVCLGLARKLTDIDFKIVFLNTGLEFPETLQYIEEVISQYNYDDRFCRMDIPTEKFWQNVEKYGPPGKDYRYCCKILKIGPINDLIEKCIGQKTLSLIGQRAYESRARAESKTLWSNPWIPNQLNFTPIQKWTALHVWLYIFKEQLHYNPLYERGFARIGCWLCPASNQGTFELIKEVSPNLWSEWNNFLESWRNKNDLPKEWLTWGLWRWKQLPKKIFDLAEEQNINLDYEKRVQKQPGDWDFQFKLTEGFATCKSGDFVFEGTFDSALNLPRLQQFWGIFSETDYDENLGILRGVASDDISVTISADGALAASGGDARKIENLLKKLILEVFRSEECTGCRVCISHCPTKAIVMNEEYNQVEIIEEYCNQCGDCHNRCPVIKFGHTEIESIFQEEKE